MNSQHPLPHNPDSDPSPAATWTRRTVLQTGTVAAAGTAVGLPNFLHANPGAADKNYLVNLDPADLPDGPLNAWPNKGSLGGAFKAPKDDMRPKVETIDGRKAVVFNGNHVLLSDFGLPEILAGNNPFTIMLWMYTPQHQYHTTMFTLGSRPKNAPEFNNHRGSTISRAAFNAAGANLGHRNGQPPQGEWHHIAYAYSGGDNGLFQLFLNGELSGETKATLRTDPGQPSVLGGAYNTEDNRHHLGFNGAFAGLQILNRPLNIREVRNAMGKFSAFAPSPNHLATIDDKQVTLRWKLGREGATPALFTATSAAALAQAQPRPLNTITVDPATGECAFGPVPLNIGDHIFWRVDQAFDNQRDPGEIWEFMASTGPATKPEPRDQLTGVSPETNQLKWQPGPYATAQLVFFGTSHEEVENATNPVARLDATANQFALQPNFEKGKTYYWRVATQNGDRPADPGQVWSFRIVDEHIKNNITFFVATDQHYGRDLNHILNHEVVNAMNSLAGTKYPNNFGAEFVRTPLCVIAPGDLLDKGYDPNTAQDRWDQWEADYGLDGTDGVLAFPVYEGIGNHDGGPDNSIPRRQIRERNKRRANQLTEISENGLHFSWDHDHVHIVNTNLFPGDTPEDVAAGNPQAHDPEMALDFLKKDLAKHVGNSGKPVIVITHYGILGGMADWWTQESKERFHQAIKDYNVIGIFNGHSHGASFLDWNNITTVHCGTTARPEYHNGDFMIVNVTETEMRVIHRLPDSNSWGINKVIPINTPAEFKA